MRVKLMRFQTASPDRSDGHVRPLALAVHPRVVRPVRAPDVPLPVARRDCLGAFRLAWVFGGPKVAA